MTSYSDIVPADLADRLIAIRDSITRDSWEIGDITEKVICFCEDNHPGTELDRIYSAVGMFVGNASRTVREKHYISNFYPLEIREAYSTLSYDHYRIAVRLGEKWRDALEWAVAQVDQLNRPCSVDAMVAKFAAPEPGEPEAPPDLIEGSGGILRLIFRSATSQMMAASNWLERELPGEVREAVEEYQEAARLVVECLPMEANPSWRGGTG